MPAASSAKSGATKPQSERYFRYFRLVYAACLALRITCALSPGYIHPDEYFQNAEPLLRGLLGIVDPVLTWEFNADRPCRSMASITIFNAPLLAFVHVYKLVYGDTLSPSGRMLFIAQRLNFFAISLVIDWAIVQLAPPKLKRRALLLFATSGAVLAFAIRPFSNNVESLLLVVSLACLQSLHSTANKWAAAESSDAKHAILKDWSALSSVLGCLFALGVFSRFTFVLFGLSLGLYYIVLAWRMSSTQASRQDASTLSQLILRVRVGRAFLLTSDLLNGLLLTSVAHILYDTVLYRALGKEEEPVISHLGLLYFIATLAKRCRFPPLIAPLNSFLYNLQEENLAEHGLHPRWLHAVVNAPMLLGIGSYLGWHFIVATTGGIGWPPQGVARSSSQAGTGFPLVQICHWVIFTSVALLSTGPHQEPRFLLPLVTPILIATLTLFSKRPRLMWTLHLVHSVILTLFFAWGHQGGLVPALTEINSHLRAGSRSGGIDITRTDRVFINVWRNFMPPKHLVLTNPSHNGGLYNELIDHGSRPAEDMLWSILHKTTGSDYNGAAGHDLLLAPAWAMNSVLDSAAWTWICDGSGSKAGLARGDESQKGSRAYFASPPSNGTSLGARSTSQTGEACYKIRVLDKVFSPHIDTDHLGESWALYQKMVREGCQVTQEQRSSASGWAFRAEALKISFGLVVASIDAC